MYFPVLVTALKHLPATSVGFINIPFSETVFRKCTYYLLCHLWEFLTYMYLTFKAFFISFLTFDSVFVVSQRFNCIFLNLHAIDGKVQNFTFKPRRFC